MIKKPESVLVDRVAILLKSKYPKLIYRFDIGADIKMNIYTARRLHALHGKYSKGHPDLVMYKAKGGFHALFIELKATDTVADTEHTRTQARYHKALRKQGYKVSFCCGFDETKKTIEKYMKLKRFKNAK